MAISQYWIGQIPARPLAIDIRDSDGRALNLGSYTSFNAILIDPDNNAVDVSGATLNTAGAASGQFVFRFPTDESLFTTTGDYLLQVELVNATAKDYTTPHTIRVRKLGGNK